jgi:tRNA pseudouridine55 synthase
VTDGPVDGLVVVDKPAGWTSHDVVARLRRVFGQRRVGHAGTLDPDATGVLLVGLGRATRLLQFLSGMAKRYSGRLVLGAATDTLDASGEIVARWEMGGVTGDAARAAAAGLVGTIEQVPPMVSAVKVGGQRLHALARAGKTVERPSRPVTVTRFDLDGPFRVDGLNGPALAFDFLVACSSGTYVRSLAADLGAALGGGAYLERLRREAVGPFEVGEAVPLEEVGPDAVRPPAEALRGFPVVQADTPLAQAVGHGRVLERARLDVAGDGPWAVLNGNGELLAVYREHTPGRAKPVVVLSGS